MVRKTKQGAQDTRNAILDAAETVFQAHGVSHTSLAAIAAAAGVTRGAVYWHFSGKAELFAAMVQRVFAPLEAKFVELQSRAEGNPLAVIRAMTHYFLERLASDPRYFRLLEVTWLKCEYVGEMATIRDTHLECGNRYLAINEKGFRLAIARGDLPAAVDAHCAAVGLMALVDGLVLNWTLDSALFPLASYGPAIVDAYLDGIAAQAARPAA